MATLNIKCSITILIFLSFLFFIALASIRNADLSSFFDLLKLVPTVISLDAFVAIIFIKWAWRWRIFKGWLVACPDLNGTWLGHIHSDWINPETGEKPRPIPVMLKVKQSLFNVSCVMQTTEMRSDSFAEGLIVKPDRQIKKLGYIYTSKPSVLLSDRSNPHDGAIEFDILDRKMTGTYWTTRKTSGEIHLHYHSPELLSEIPENYKQHPVTEETNKLFYK